MPDSITPRHLTDANVDVLTSFYPVPGLGVVPINAFLLRSAQPVLIDAGAVVLRDSYLAAVQSLIDLEDLRWVYLTHTDPDHIGCLRDVLVHAPKAKVITTFLGLGKLGLLEPLAPERVYLLNPGQSLDIGDRELRALRPPIFDAPETTGFLDSKTGALFSSDCFGALLTEPVEHTADLTPPALRAGMVLWATIDAPWLGRVRASHFDATLEEVRELAPPIILGSHLPPAFGMIDTLIENVRAAREAPPFVGPDQAALTAMLSTSEPPKPTRERRHEQGAITTQR